MQGDYFFNGVTQIVTGEPHALVVDRPVLLVSGIGQPLAFEELIKGEDVSFEKHLRYRDHYEFEESDYKKIMKTLNELEAQVVICTRIFSVSVRFLPITGSLESIETKQHKMRKK